MTSVSPAAQASRSAAGRHRSSAALLLVVLVVSSCATGDGGGRRVSRRGFESGSFRGWYREFPDDDAASIVTDPVADGEFAARFEVSSDDRRITGGLRSEVSELWHKAPFGREMWYRFSTFIPADIPTPTYRCVIAQWHAWPDLLRGEAWRSPVIAIEYRLDQMMIRICHNAERVQKDNSQASNNKTVLYRSPEHGKRDVWHQFVARVVFDPFSSGELTVWIDGDQVVDYHGPLAYNDRKGPWFKMGIYRDAGPSPFVIYHDDYRRGRSAADIGLPGYPATRN